VNVTEKYYAINTALNTYLKSKGITCPVLKYGIDPAAAKANKKDNVTNKYPYMQSYFSNIKETSWTSELNGIYTTFDYQISFFTAPDTEYTNDAKLFYPFEVAKNAMGDVQLNLLSGIASILRKKGHYESGMKSGQLVPAAFIIYSMATVCSYEAIVPVPANATNIDNAIVIN